MATITWRGDSGNWSSGLSWSLFREPVASDSVLLGGSGPYTVTVDVAAAAQDVTLTAVGAILDVKATLVLGGTLSLAAGTELVLAGTIVGGTIDSTGGVNGGFGTLDGTALVGGIGGAFLSDVTITAATATANVGTEFDIGGTVGLAAGSYDSTSFVIDLTAGSGTLGTAGTATVTFTATTTINLFEDASQLTFPPSGQTAALVGAGSMLNLGTIVSNFSNQNGGTLAISVASFVNDNLMSFAPLLLPEEGTFVVGYQQFQHGRVPIVGVLDWTQGYAATLEIGSASFVNNANLSIDGGTLDLTGAQFVNAGVVSLSDVSVQRITTDAQGVTSVQDVTLVTRLEVGAATVFDNTGAINADTIVFDGSVTLASLGTLHGALSFLGTLDLGGGTLDAGQYTQITLGGLIENGSIGPGVLVLDGATLDNVTIVSGGSVQSLGPITLIDPPASVTTVMLDATTTELRFSAGATSEISVIAGTTQVTDLIRVADGGTVVFGPAFSLSDDVAGSTLDVDGLGTLVHQGTISLDGATLRMTPTLDGGGTIVLADSAAVTLDALSATATVTIEFGAGPALLVLPGSGSFGVSFVGLHAGDVIDFTSISSVPDGQFGTGGAVQIGGTLLVQGASGANATLQSSGAADGLTFGMGTDAFGGTVLTVIACFAQGTRIATEGGEVAVERLRPGHIVRTHSGKLAAVRWVGYTRIDLARHPTPERAAPVRIRAGAFADGLPRRDLLVSPEHCLLIDDSLVPAFLLVNGATIARQDGLAEIIYWHVELDHHDVLLAEGLPAESYLDTGNRALFLGQAGVRSLHPTLVGAPDAAALLVWASSGCAPLRLDASVAHARLWARALALGWSQSDAPALRVLAHGRPLALVATDGGVRMRVPAEVTSLQVLSDSFVPAEIVSGSGDMRRLGIAVSAVRLAGRDVGPGALAIGWHAARAENWRWSDGAATIVVPRLTRAATLEIALAVGGLYWQPPPEPVADLSDWTQPSVGATFLAT